MKYLCILIFTLTLTTTTRSQPRITSHVDTVHSNILRENRRVCIYLPGSYGDTYFYPRHYPVLYLLDAEGAFNTVTSIVQLLSEGRGPLEFPELIIVAIANTDRMRDLSPTHVTHDLNPHVDSNALKNTGGGEKFLSYIDKELMPHIDSAYRTTPYKIFMGHSLGGLTVINAFLHHTTMFNAYIATDPSMFWDDARLVSDAAAMLEKNKFAGRSLYLAIANNTPPGLDTISVRKDTTHPFSSHMRAIFRLRDLIVKAHPQTDWHFIPFTGNPPTPETIPSWSSSPGSSSPSDNFSTNSSSKNLSRQAPFRFAWKYYPDYDHGALPMPAQYDGLRFTFSFYSLYFPFYELFQPSWKQDNLLENHYKLISYYMGYKVSPPEVPVNDVGYRLLGAHQLDRAAYYFHLNIDNYPESFNVYDSMGDLLAAQQQKDSAIKCYQQALLIREEPGTREKMEQLRR